MRAYSLTLIVSPDLKETDRKKLLDTVGDYLKESKGLKTDEWGQKPLTYPIKHQVAGFFVDYLFEMENLPEDLEKKLLTSDGVLRHLLLKVKSPKVQKVEKAEKKVVSKSLKTEEEKAAAKSSKPKKTAKKVAKANK